MNTNKVLKVISKASTIKAVGMLLKRKGEGFVVNGTGFISVEEAAKHIAETNFFEAVIGRKTYRAEHVTDEDGITYSASAGSIYLNYPIDNGWIMDCKKGTEREIDKEEFDRLVKKYNIDVF